MSRLAARVLTGTTLAVVVVGLLWLNTRLPRGVLALVVAAVLAFVSLWELDRMGSFRGRGLHLPLYGALMMLVSLEFAQQVNPRSRELGVLTHMAWHYALCLAAVPLALLAPFSSRKSGARLSTPWSAVPLALWLLPPLFALILIDEAFGVRGLVALIALSKIGDNAGFFVGRKLGKRHPFPSISPGKTVAGCVASLVAGIAGGALLLPFTLGERTPAQFGLGALVGGLVNVAAQASDLSESWVKRRAGVKDSSALLGPSGGVLDVIDSLFFAAPLALLLFTWLYSPSLA